MSKLAELIEASKERIVASFIDRARATVASGSMPPNLLRDSLDDFLLDLVARLREESAGAEEAPVHRSVAASEHGRQRFTLGYDLGGLIREYAILRDVIYEVIEQDRNALSIHDFRSLSKVLVGAIGDAATEYGIAKEAEVTRQIGQHIGFLAHELRNPLGSARLGLELLLRRGECVTNRSSALVMRSLNRVATLIDHALIEQRLRTGPSLTLTAIQLPEFVQEILEEHESDAEDRKVRLAVYASGDPSVVADPRVLRSALTNLIGNAIKFTKPGGAVTVTTKTGEGRAVIEVKDACGGLPEGQVQKLFDPFVQAGKDRSGFGLGLAIAKQAVEAHKGSLRVHNLPGEGCVFLLDLPQPPPAP